MAGACFLGLLISIMAAIRFGVQGMRCFVQGGCGVWGLGRLWHGILQPERSPSWTRIVREEYVFLFMHE